MYCTFVGTSYIHWYLQRDVSFFVFIVKWNIKHNTNDLQNTYISVNHSIVQYQTFSSIERYLKIMYSHGENETTQWFNGYIFLSRSQYMIRLTSKVLSLNLIQLFLHLVQPFIYTHSVKYNSFMLDMPHYLIVPYTFFNEYIFPLIYVFSFYFVPFITHFINHSYTTWTYSKSCHNFLCL